MVDSSVGFKHIPASYCAMFFCTAFWKSHVLPPVLPRRQFSVSTNNLLDLATYAFSISDLRSTAMHSNRKLCTLKRLHLLWMQTLHFLNNLDYCKHLLLDYSYNRQHRTKPFINIIKKKKHIQKFTSTNPFIMLILYKISCQTDFILCL